MSTPLLAAEISRQLQPVEQQILPEHYAEISLDGPAVDVVTDKLGNNHEVLAWIDVPSDQFNTSTSAEPEYTRAAILKPHPAPNGKHKEQTIRIVEYKDGEMAGAQTLKFDGKKPKSENSELNGGRTSFASHIIKKGRKQKLLIDYGGTDKDRPSPILTTAEETATIHSGNAYESVVKTQHRERRMKRFQKIAAVVGAYATFSSGGMIDRVGDIHDAGKVVENTFSHQSKGSIYNPVWMYGDYANSTPSTAEHEKAVENASNAMEALDKHDTETIMAKAQQYKETNADEIMPEKQIEAYHEQLKQAKTPQEALDVLSSFMGFYDKTARFLSTDSTDNHISLGSANEHTVDVRMLRRAITGVMNAFGPLPAFLVTTAPNFKDVALSDGSLSVGGDVDQGSIIIPIPSKVSVTLDTAGNMLPDAVMEETTEVHSALHELGHGEDYFYGEQAESIDPAGNKLASAARFAVSKAMQTNSEQSLYSTWSSIREKNAEDFAAAFDLVDSSGLAHPDQWRQFNSEANKRAMAVLIGYEVESPGLVWYVISKRLAKRSETQTPILPYVHTP